MSRTKIALVCVPVALAGLAVAAHASWRLTGHERELAALAEAGQASGRSFVATLRGEHAERQQMTFDRRRVLALSLAAARRDRLVGLLLLAAAGLGAAALTVLSRIAAEIEDDRRHLAADRRDLTDDRRQRSPPGGERGPDRS
jgi:hypothetical protein